MNWFHTHIDVFLGPRVSSVAPTGKAATLVAVAAAVKLLVGFASQCHPCFCLQGEKLT